MPTFRVIGRESGALLGEYEATSAEDALETLALDAGYDGYEAMVAVIGECEAEEVVPDLTPEEMDRLGVEPAFRATYYVGSGASQRPAGSAGIYLSKDAFHPNHASDPHVRWKRTFVNKEIAARMRSGLTFHQASLEVEHSERADAAVAGAIERSRGED